MILRFGNKRGGEDKQHDCQIVSSEQLGKNNMYKTMDIYTFIIYKFL